MVEFLLDALDGAAVFLDAILELVLLLAHRGELLLELGTIAKQVHEFVRVLLRLFRQSFEDSRQARHSASLYIIHNRARVQARY